MVSLMLQFRSRAFRGVVTGNAISHRLLLFANQLWQMYFIGKYVTTLWTHINRFRMQGASENRRRKGILKRHVSCLVPPMPFLM